MARRKPKRINEGNEDLIGQTFRLPGSISNRVVVDIDPDTEGMVQIAHAETLRDMGLADAAAVRQNLR
jgi:hypothetical protein